VNFYYTRWWWFGGWQWEGNNGRFAFAEQLSDDTYQQGDKWNVINVYTPVTRNNLWLGDVAFGTKGWTGTWPSASADPCDSDGGPLGPAMGAAAPSSLASGYTVSVSERTVGSRKFAEVYIQPDLSRGLSDYADTAKVLAGQLIKSGPAAGVITFAIPVGRAELEQMEDLGLVIHTIEAVSTELPSGLRLTYSNSFGPHVWDQMQRSAVEYGTEMLGVVSAEVTVPSAAAYRRLQARDDVFLIDLSPEQIRRSTPGADPDMNDLYWHVAGWIAE
jgi:hypothetical protein